MANLRYCAQTWSLAASLFPFWPNSSQHVANSHCPRRVWQDRFETTTVVALFVPGKIGWPCYHLLSINYFRSPWSSHIIPNSSKRGTDQKDLWVFGFDPDNTSTEATNKAVDMWIHILTHTHVIYIYIYIFIWTYSIYTILYIYV